MRINILMLLFLTVNCSYIVSKPTIVNMTEEIRNNPRMRDAFNFEIARRLVMNDRQKNENEKTLFERKEREYAGDPLRLVQLVVIVDCYQRGLHDPAELDSLFKTKGENMQYIMEGCMNTLSEEIRRLARICRRLNKEEGTRDLLLNFEKERDAIINPFPEEDENRYVLQQVWDEVYNRPYTPPPPVEIPVAAQAQQDLARVLFNQE